MNPDTPEESPSFTPRKSPRWGRIMIIVVLVLACAFAVDYVIFEQTRPTLLSEPVIEILRSNRVSVSWEMEASYPEGYAKLSPAQGRPLKVNAERDGTAYSVTFEGVEPGAAYQCRVYNRGYLGRSIKVAGPIEVTLPAAPKDSEDVK